MDHLTEMSEDEHERLENAASNLQLNSRLGCQSVVKGGDVTVEVVNVET
jgi:ferredoxin